MTKSEKELYIEMIVCEFYRKAINDVFIGYHFRKISNRSDNLEQDLGAFSKHIPRITSFWKSQLIGTPKLEDAKHILHAHENLNIRKGELGRWLTLFRQELKNHQESELTEFWLSKIDTFEKAFTNYFFED